MPFQPVGRKTLQNFPFPLGHVNLNLIHPSLRPPDSTPNDSSIDSCNFAHLHPKVPIGYNGTPHIFTAKITPSFKDLHPI